MQIELIMVFQVFACHIIFKRRRMAHTGDPPVQMTRSSIPQVTVFIAARGGVVSSFVIKVDPKMTVETMRETVWMHYLQHINSLRDIGSNFGSYDPKLLMPSKSDNPQDYDIRPCDQEGVIQAKLPPYQEARYGGNFIRAQLLTYTKPYYVVMVIGRHWLARDALCNAEAQVREMELYDLELRVRNVIEVELYTASKNKMASLERSRLEAAATVQRFEGLMLKSVLAEIEKNKAEQRVLRHLEVQRAKWTTTVIEREEMSAATMQSHRLLLTDYTLLRLK